MLKIYKDEFLRKHIVEIHQNQNKTIVLKTRVLDFEVVIGNLDKLDKKVNNFKAFYQKAKKDNQQINLVLRKKNLSSVVYLRDKNTKTLNDYKHF